MNKIEVITKDGRTVRIMPHMIADAERFEATKTRKTVKETPEELKSKPMKVAEEIKDPLPEMKITDPVEIKSDVLEKTPSKRKSPVKSKSTK